MLSILSRAPDWTSRRRMPPLGLAAETRCTRRSLIPAACSCSFSEGQYTFVRVADVEACSARGCLLYQTRMKRSVPGLLLPVQPELQIIHVVQQRLQST